MKLVVAIALASTLLGVSCVRKQPSAASREVADVQARFPQYAAWERTNHDALTRLAEDIQSQGSFRRIIWSRPPEYFTVIRRDGSILQGFFSTNAWPQDARFQIESWVDRLKATGCQGFDDQGSNWAISLYLDVNVYVAKPSTSNSPLIAQYESWAAKGLDVRGDACTNLNNGWFLCTERR